MQVRGLYAGCGGGGGRNLATELEKSLKFYPVTVVNTLHVLGSGHAGHGNPMSDVHPFSSQGPIHVLYLLCVRLQVPKVHICP